MRRLCRWVGVPWEVYLARTERANLFRRWPGRAGGQGDRFNALLARREAEAFRPSLAGRRVALLGWGIAAAFGCRRPPCRAPFEQVRMSRPAAWEAFLIPHPLGISHSYNSAANREAAGRLFRSLLEGVNIGACEPPRRIRENPAGMIRRSPQSRSRSPTSP